jgi:small subunit ribosomal protein S10
MSKQIWDVRRITIKSNDAQLLDSMVSRIIKAAKDEFMEDVKIVVAALPTKVKKISVLSSPTIYKSSFDQYTFSTHKRLIDLHLPNGKDFNVLNEHIKCPAGISISLKNLTSSK